MEVWLGSTCHLCLSQCTQTPGLSLSGPWGPWVTISLTTLHPHPLPLGPQLHFGSGLCVWSLPAGGTSALCERCLLWMGPSDVPCAWCCPCAHFFLSLPCLGVTVPGPVLSGMVTEFHSLFLPLPAVHRCSGAAPGCGGKSLCWGHTWHLLCFLATANPGCCWTLLQCPVIKSLPQCWQPILP